MSSLSKFFKNVGKAFTNFLRNLCYDIKDSFKIKPWNVCTILFMIPGLFVGLFLGSHYEASSGLPSEYSYAGFYLFALTLLGCINIFNAMSFAAKRSLGMAIFSTITSILLTLFGVLYSIQFIQANNDGWDVLGTSTIVSMSIVGVSCLSSLIAAGLTYKFIDKNRIKD